MIEHRGTETRRLFFMLWYFGRQNTNFIGGGVWEIIRNGWSETLLIEREDMKFFVSLMFLFCWNSVFADIGFAYFYMEGKVFDIHKQPLRNECIFFRDAAGEISRVQTDSNGVYRVRSNYVTPCLSGSGGGRFSERDRKSAFGCNSPTISVYFESYCDELPQQWSQFYFDRSKPKIERKTIQNIHLKKANCKSIDNRLEKRRQEYLKFKTKIAMLPQNMDSTKFTDRLEYDFKYNRSYYEPLGLTENDFLESMGLQKEGVLVDFISSERIVLSFLSLGYSDNEIRRCTYIYFKENGIIVREEISYKTEEY